MNRSGGLWTLSGRGWFTVFAVIIVLLGVWIGIDAAQPANVSTSGGGARGSQTVPQPAVAKSGTAGGASSPKIVEPPLLGKKAAAVLALLPVHSADSGADYQPTQQFGEAWMDVDGNGCDTRDDMLARDLSNTAVDACKVMSGKFVDPYTGKPITFTRSNDTTTLVQVDHIVSLLDAWTTGAQKLTQDQRQRLANDPTNLLTVSDKANQDKNDADAAKWLPSYAGIHCEYAARQISVKYAYGLWVTKAEHDSLAAILRTCPDQPAYRSALTTAAVSHTSAPAALASGTVGATAAAVYYANCSAAYAAGVSRIKKGAPGYRPELDRDDDGIACEG